MNLNLGLVPATRSRLVSPCSGAFPQCGTWPRAHQFPRPTNRSWPRVRRRAQALRVPQSKKGTTATKERGICSSKFELADRRAGASRSSRQRPHVRLELELAAGSRVRRADVAPDAAFHNV